MSSLSSSPAINFQHKQPDTHNTLSELANSHLVRIKLLETFTLISGAVAYRHPRMLAVSALFVSALAAYQIHYAKQVLNETRMTTHYLTNKTSPEAFPWFSEMISGKLTLGALPLQEHLTELQERGITDIFSAIEGEEYGPKFAIEGCRLLVPLRFKPSDTCFKNIEIPDYGATDPVQIGKAMDFIQEKIQQGGHVYVHCKAGKGRSVLVVMAFLLKHGIEHAEKGSELHLILDAMKDKSITERKDALYAWIKSKRPQVKMSEEQQQAVVDYMQTTSKQ